MIAGTLVRLSDPAEEPLEDYHDSGGRVLEVDASHTYLDGHRIQSGTIAGRVSVEEERVTTTGGEIDIERRQTERTVATEWVGDVDSQGWLLAERTWPTDREHDPDWPFSAVETLTGREVVPQALDPAAFVTTQRDAERSHTVEMATVDTATRTQIQWGDAGDQGSRANTGVALTTHWGSEFVRLVIYESGYVAIWEPADLAPEQLGRFVHDELLPIAEAVTEDETEQQEVDIHA